MKSASTLGRCTLTATLRPCSTAVWTWPIDAVARGSGACRSTQLLAERTLDVLHRERRDAVEQVEQLVAVFQGHDVGLQREHLSELDEAAAEILEQSPESLRSRQSGERDARGQPGPDTRVADDDEREAVADQHPEEVQQPGGLDAGRHGRPAVSPSVPAGSKIDP